jgi:hypothetical protein
LEERDTGHTQIGQGAWYDFVKVNFQLNHNRLDTTIYPDNDMQYPAKLVCFYRLIRRDEHVVADPDYSVLAHCAAFQSLSSSVYKRKTLLTRSWKYKATSTNIQRPVYTVVGTVKEPDIGGQIFAMEENLGFNESYSSSVHRSWEQCFIVLSDMRKDWPNVFMKDTVNNGNLDNH